MKYSASLSRDFYFNVFHKIHLNGAWFGGRDLDRFAKYQFGMFDDTRIHGVPGVRRRASTSWRWCAARTRSTSSSSTGSTCSSSRPGAATARSIAAWQPITGLGAAVNLRAPWNTILRADVGKSFLPERYRGIGSATLQIMMLKPLR